MEKIKTLIVGAGASGLTLASKIGNSDVMLVERLDRVGKKLSATGNGQGNVSNEGVGVDKYFTSDARAYNKIEKMLARYGKDELIRFFESKGAVLTADERGRIYPAGKQASALTDLLRYDVAQRGVKVCLSTRVSALYRQGDGFLVTTENESGKKSIFAQRVVLCAGGKAAKNFGTDGSAYALATALGHSVTALYPSLVQLKTDTEHIKSLKGIRVYSQVKALINGKEVACETGDVIFTDYGVSGDVIFRLSAFVSDKTEGDVTLSIDLLPDISEQKLREVLQQKSKLTHIPSGEILCGILNNQVGRAVVKRAKSESVNALVDVVKRFKLKVTGTLGYDYAQVTKGGIPLSEVDDTLQSKSCKGLYLAGEILDVDGRCGGYNLQWAFTSASVIADALKN